jgi:hypothetical protein
MASIPQIYQVKHILLLFKKTLTLILLLFENVNLILLKWQSHYI